MLKPILIALAAGAVLPVQALINGRLSSALGSPLMAGNISFLVAALTLALLQLVLGHPLPSAQQLASVPAWIWLGGMLGVVYVVGAIISVGAIGTTSAISLIIAGQIGAALLADHFGLFGAAGNSVGLLRLCGAGLVVIGAIMAVRG